MSQAMLCLCFQSLKREKARAGNMVLAESKPFIVHDRGLSSDGTLIPGYNIIVSIGDLAPTWSFKTPNTQVS